MAMVVKNNMSAVNTLNTLNKNQSALGKSLQKVSSGMKINSAQDDASGYAISERMRVMIRSLDQANQNTQNGSSLMKVAEGAVSNTVEILKTLKEKAINAATDTNTDEDRAIIQKEIDQLVDQIDDNALITFNGKYLLDGSKVQSGQATYTTFTNQMLAIGTSGSDALTSLKNRNSEDLGIISTDKVTASYVRNGETFVTTFAVSDCTLNDIFKRLESLEDETQFAGATNKSVLAAIGGDFTAEDVDKTSTDTVSKYSMEALEAAEDIYTAKLNEAQAAADEAHAKVGYLLDHSVWYNTETKAYEVNSQKASGLAGEIAQVLVEAANLGDLMSTNTGTVGYFTDLSSSTSSSSDTVKNMAVWFATFSTTTPSTTAVAGTTSLSSDNAVSDVTQINLTGLSYASNAVVSDATLNSNTYRLDAMQWDGLSFAANNSDSSVSDLVQTALENVQKRLNAVTKADAGEDKYNAAQALAVKLNSLISEYDTALKEATAADTVLEAAKKDLGYVTDAISVEDLKAAMEIAHDGMADAILTELNQLAHPRDSEGSIMSNTALLNNQLYYGVKLVGEDTYSSTSVTAVTSASSYTNLGQYSSDNNEALSDISKRLADYVYANVVQYVDGKPWSDTSLGHPVAGDSITAQDAVRYILSTFSSSSDTSNWTAVGNIASYTAIGYGSDTSTDWAGGVTGNWGSDILTLPATYTPDINGFAAAYDKYAEKMYSVASLNKAKLDSLMSDVSITSSNDPYLISSKNIGLNTANAMVTTADGTEGITVTSNIAGLRGQISGITISVADAQGNVRKSVNTSLNAWGVTIFASNEAEKDNSLKFHIGAQANQSIAVDIKDMRAAALGLKGDDGKVVSVATQEKANAAIAVFENALQKALDMQTTIGAIEARLEYTSSNLTTSTENVQAAESTIRDADMAKEMTNYTKNNVLLQAAQSMLAQANQNSSAVLSLLQ